MQINESQTLAHEPIIFYKIHYFLMFSHDGPGQLLQQRQNFRPVAKIAASQLTDDEGMAHHPAFQQ